MYENAELAVKNAFGTDAEGAEDAVYESQEAKLLPNQTDHLNDTGILSPLMSMAKSQARGFGGESEKRTSAAELGDEGTPDKHEIGHEIGGDAPSGPSRVPADVDPADATAVSVTCTFSSNCASHVPPQLMPDGADATLPEPVPVFVRVRG